MSQNSSMIDAIVVGAGLPDQSIGWLHIEQLMNFPQVNIRYIVSTWWLGDQADIEGKNIFIKARDALQTRAPHIQFLQSVDAIPSLKEDSSSDERPCIAFICSKTEKAPELFKKLIQKGVTHIYLEKPGAATAKEIQDMRSLAEKSGTVVIVGYQKCNSEYIHHTLEASNNLKPEETRILFEHHNPHPKEKLESLFLANSEGMLLNQCSHEIAVLVKHWGVRSENIQHIEIDQSETVWNTYSNISDFSRIAFTITCKNQLKIKVLATRCDGVKSFTTVVNESTNRSYTFPLSSPSDIQSTLNKIQANPNYAWYLNLFSDDYIRLKSIFIEYIVKNDQSVLNELFSLSDAVEVFNITDRVLNSYKETVYETDL